MPTKKTTKKVKRSGTASPPPPPPVFPNKRSSGVFSASRNVTAIDWAVINGGSYPHWIRVTTYKCPVGAAKIVIAGPTAVYLNPTVTAHESVAVTGGTPDHRSTYYEVVVEDEDLNLHPSVQLFCKYPTDVAAGWLIPPGDFVQTQT